MFCWRISTCLVVYICNLLAVSSYCNYLEVSIIKNRYRYHSIRVSIRVLNFCKSQSTNLYRLFFYSKKIACSGLVSAPVLNTVRLGHLNQISVRAEPVEASCHKDYPSNLRANGFNRTALGLEVNKKGRC